VRRWAAPKASLTRCRLERRELLSQMRCRFVLLPGESSDSRAAVCPLSSCAPSRAPPCPQSEKIELFLLAQDPCPMHPPTIRSVPHDSIPDYGLPLGDVDPCYHADLLFSCCLSAYSIGAVSRGIRGVVFVTLPSSESGTLKSTRIKTRLFFQIEVSDRKLCHV